jgi:hypothetical protein
VAGAWVEMMTYELASQAFQRGLKYLVFSDPRMGPHAVEQGDSLNKYLSGFVLDYPATQKNLDREIANLRYAKGEEGIAN